MKATRSGEYRLPGPFYCAAGNVVLRLSPWIPSWARSRFAHRRTSYQTIKDIEMTDDQQGLSIRKWEAIRMPSHLHGKSVIDIGCSEGFFSQQCARRGAVPVFGIDSSFGRLLYATFMAIEKGLDIRYRLGVFPSRLVTGKFDYVLCLSVLHHFLTTKDLWKVLSLPECVKDLSILRKQLQVLRSLTADNGKCVLEIPYEYDDPDSERQVVDFQLFLSELKAAGFATARCLGTWDYNPRHRAFKDRIIYVAEA